MPGKEFEGSPSQVSAVPPVSSPGAPSSWVGVALSKGGALPPGPRGRLVQMARYFRDPYRFFAACQARYGPIFTLPFFGARSPIVAFGDIEGLRAVFTADVDQFEVAHPEAFLPIVGDRSLLGLNGAAHRSERKLMAPPFHGSSVRAYGGTIASIAETACARWRPGEVVDARALTRELSLEVILRVVFGVENEAAVQRFRAAIAEYLAPAGLAPLVFPPLRTRLLPFWRRFVAARDRIDALVYAQIAAARRRATPGHDILSLLVGARYDDGSAMEDSAIRDELLTLLIAGHETSAHTLAWALHVLHRRPDILARLRFELDGLGSDAGAEAIAAAPFLEAVCYETLRAYPILTHMPRRLRRPFTLLGREIPAGVVVAPSVLMAHRNQALFPEPHVFRPERFLDRRFSPFEFLPFGIGDRRCIGAALATYEMKLLLATLLRRARFTPMGPAEIRAGFHGLAIGPMRPVPLRIEQVAASVAARPLAPSREHEARELTVPVPSGPTALARRRDVVGEWFYTCAALGENMEVRFGSIAERGAPVEWTNLHHGRFDGIGGLVCLFRQAGLQVPPLPTLKEQPKPSAARVARWFAREIFKRRPIYQWPALPAPASAGLLPAAIATHVFDEADTAALLRRARGLGVTVNTLLLDRVSRAVRPRLTGAPPNLTWRIGVNMRGAVRVTDETANHAVSITIEVRQDEPVTELHRRVRDAFATHEHWAQWWFFKAGRVLGPSGRRRAMKPVVSGPRISVGSLSNLGAWNPTGDRGPYAFVFCPPTISSAPLSVGCVTYRGRLALALQLHPTLTTEQRIASEWLTDSADALSV